MSAERDRAAGPDPGRVAVSRRGEVAHVRLCREAKLNALSTRLETQLCEALRGPEVRTSRAVVLTGGHAVFSAGADVAELREMTPQRVFDYYRDSGAVYGEFAALPQPTVAAIAGWCVGGGLELALAADMRVADPSAVFALPEVGLGILPSSGGVVRLTRMLGTARARDLVLRGRRFSAAQALDWGLLSEVTGPGEHVRRAGEIADELAAQSAAALAVTQQVLDAAAEASERGGLLLEQLAYAALVRGSE